MVGDVVLVCTDELNIGWKRSSAVGALQKIFTKFEHKVVKYVHV